MAAARPLIVLLLASCVSDFEVEDGVYDCSSDADCLEGRFCSPVDHRCSAVQVPGDCLEDERPVVPCSGSLAGEGPIPTVAARGLLSFVASERLMSIDAEGRCVSEQRLPPGASARRVAAGPGGRLAVAGIIEDEVFVWRAAERTLRRLPRPPDSSISAFIYTDRIRVGFGYTPAPTEAQPMFAIDADDLRFGEASFSDPRGCDFGGVRALACRLPRCHTSFAVIGRARCGGPSLEGRARFELEEIDGPVRASWDSVDERVAINVDQLVAEDGTSALLAGRLFDPRSGQEASCVLWRSRWGEAPGDEVLAELEGMDCFALRATADGQVLVGGSPLGVQALWVSADGGTTSKERAGGVHGGAAADSGVVWLLRRTPTGLCASQLEAPDGE